MFISLRKKLEKMHMLRKIFTIEFRIISKEDEKSTSYKYLYV